MAAINAVNCGNIYQLRGLSSDKASVDTGKIGVGTTYYEIDTKKCYIYNGTTWIEVTNFTIVA